MANRPDHNPPESAHISSESQRLRELLAPTVASHHLILEDVLLHLSAGQRTVHLIVDLSENETGGVSLDQVSEVSADLSKVLDEDPQDSGAPYDLEVSSPGVSRPLTEPRHWRRAKGRMVVVDLTDQHEVRGRLLDVDDSGVTVRPETVVKKGMKPKQGEPQHLAFDQIRAGRVEIEFSRSKDAELGNGSAGGNNNSSAEEA